MLKALYYLLMTGQTHFKLSPMLSTKIHCVERIILHPKGDHTSYQEPKHTKKRSLKIYLYAYVSKENEI